MLLTFDVGAHKVAQKRPITKQTNLNSNLILIANQTGGGCKDIGVNKINLIKMRKKSFFYHVKIKTFYLYGSGEREELPRNVNISF